MPWVILIVCCVCVAASCWAIVSQGGPDSNDPMVVSAQCTFLFILSASLGGATIAAWQLNSLPLEFVSGVFAGAALWTAGVWVNRRRILLNRNPSFKLPKKPMNWQGFAVLGLLGIIFVYICLVFNPAGSDPTPGASIKTTAISASTTTTSAVAPTTTTTLPKMTVIDGIETYGPCRFNGVEDQKVGFVAIDPLPSTETCIWMPDSLKLPTAS